MDSKEYGRRSFSMSRSVAVAYRRTMGAVTIPDAADMRQRQAEEHMYVPTGQVSIDAFARIRKSITRHG